MGTRRRFDAYTNAQASGAAARRLDPVALSQLSAVVIDESVITEGQLNRRTANYRKRSNRLRDAAVQHCTVGGKLPCASCSFDFDRAYVGIGAGYIQIHHLEPIAFGGARELTLSEAIEKVRPLCANCHVMVHRKDPWLTMERLTDSLSVTFDYQAIDYADLGETAL